MKTIFLFLAFAAVAGVIESHAVDVRADERSQLPTQVVATNVHAVCPDSNTAFTGYVDGDTVRFTWAQHLKSTKNGQVIPLPPIQWLSTPALAGMLDQQGRYVPKHPAWPVVIQARQG